MGGSSKKVTVGYRYFVGMHLILCHGEADKLVQIKVDDREAWLGTSTGGQIYINKPSLFGGESREGGIEGAVDIEMGSNTQMPNSYLVSKLGPLVPAFRGVVGIVLRQVFMGLNPYLKNWAFRLQRIHKRFDGQLQWYDETAEIGTVPSDTIVPITGFWDYQIVSNNFPGAIPSGGYSNARAPFGDNPSFTPPYPIQTSWPRHNAIWLRRTIEANGKFPIKITGRIENAIWIYWDGEFIYGLNTDNEDIAGLPFFEIDVPISKATAGSHTLHIYCMDEFGNLPQSNTYVYANVRYVSYGAMNPAHIIRECLTDPDWGMGYQDADINDASFIAAADRLYEESMGMCILWDTQTSIEEFVKEIARHIDAALFVDRQTGQFVLKLIRDDYDEGSLITLDEDNIDKITDFKRPTFGELINAVTVTYWDISLGEDSTLTVSDIALAQQQGNTNLSSIKYPGFVSGEIASRVAQRDLTTLSTPLASCTIYANRDADELNIGSVFKLTWPDYDIFELVMRVTGIAYGDGKTNRVRIQCAQDVFALPAEAFIPEVPPVWEDPTQEPTPVVHQLAFEVPYLELVQVQGQTAVDGLLSSNPDAGYVGAAAARPASSALYTRLFTDNGAGYEEAGQVEFAPFAELAEDIDELQEDFLVSNPQDFEELVLGSWFEMGDELFSYEGSTGNTVHTKRGVLDTTPKRHYIGEPLIFWDYYAEADPTEYVASDVVSVKLPTVTGGGQLELENAPASVVELRSRAVRPYPPGRLRFDDEPYPAFIPSDSVTVSWVHRDRLQQTGQVLIGAEEGSIGPETGTTYAIKLYDEFGVLQDEIDNINDLSQLVELGSLPSDIATIEVYSDRDNYLSWQAARHTFQFLLIVISTEHLAAIEDVPYSEILQVIGGDAPYEWSVISGSLPAGLSLNTSTGEISGVPTSTGLSTFEIEVEDGNGKKGTRTFNMRVGVLISLMHYDGANNSTTFTDETGRTWNRLGNARLSTTYAAFGPSSYTPFSTASSITTGAFGIGPTDDFTIQFFYRTGNVTTDSATILDGRSAVGQTNGFLVTQTGADPSEMGVYLGDSNAGDGYEVQMFSGAGSLVANTAVFVTIRRRGSTFELFFNGVLRATAEYSGNIEFGTTLVSLGSNKNNTASVTVNGFIDEFRVVGGAAMKADVPSAAFPNPI